jgi:exopolysaccharide biosynthesis polyprenyl glycosylphosphotransferase
VLYQNVHIFAPILRVLDAAVAASALALIWILGEHRGALADAAVFPYGFYSASLIGGFFAVAGRLRIYHARRTETLARELLSLIETYIFAAGLGCLATEMCTQGLPARAYAATFLASGAALIGARAAVRFALRGVRRIGKDQRTWLVIGRNARSAGLLNDILKHPHYGIRVAAVLDFEEPRDGARRRGAGGLEDAPFSSFEFRQLDSAESIRGLLAREMIDEVVVTLTMRSFYDQIQAILLICAQAGVSVKLPANSFEDGPHQTGTMQVASMHFVTHYSGPSNHIALALKRIMDIVVAFFGLLVTWPFFILVSIAIKLDSEGPVFFRQTRVGLNGRLFTLYKFRTMVRNAAALKTTLEERNEADGPVFKIRNDPRVTRVGRWLRRFHVDELPQLWNVLVGAMSLVGPRPPLPEETAKYEWWQRRRLSMPPGLTCLWQVKGHGESLTFRRWMELDLEYIDRWSLLLDLQVLVATVGTMIRGRGW